MAATFNICIVFMIASSFLVTSECTIFVTDNEDDIRNAYEEIRSYNPSYTWVTVVYEGKQLKLGETGTEYADFVDQLEDDNRVYGYVKYETSEYETTPRPRYAFITWIGPSVSPLKKAKVSTDKAFVKQIWPNFNKEILADEKSEVNYNKVVGILAAASGASYGTGQKAVSLDLDAKKEEELKEYLIKRLLEELINTN